MGGPAAPREHALGRVAHPEYLRLPGRPAAITLIDDPLIAPLHDGYGPLGWEGDPRLAVYVDGNARSWILVRLEADGQYRPVAETGLGAAHVAPVDIVGQLIQFLVTHDSRRGYDPLADADRHNALLEAEQERQLSDRVVNDLAPRLRHALRKDGVDGWR